jgi:Inositol-pentakisphosphate 2-kinase
MCASPASCQWMQSWTASQQDTARSAEHMEWERAHATLHGGSWHDAFQALRDYMVAAAAKDCSIMIAFASCKPCPSRASSASSLASCEACAQQLRSTRSRLGGIDAAATSDHAKPVQDHTCMGYLPLHGLSFVYRLGVVDFDCKPLPKIVEHKRKDDSILECWSTHDALSTGVGNAAVTQRR